MDNKALVVIDIQNDITKHYHDIVAHINDAIDWATNEKMHVIYIKHNNMTTGTRTFKPGEAFTSFIDTHGINEFYVAGADATACVKSTCFNMRKAGYQVHVLCDCITSYDLKKLPVMLTYYEKQGCELDFMLKRA